MCTYFSERAKLFFVTFMGGQTYIGKLSADMCRVDSYFCLELQKQAKDPLTKSQVEKNGGVLVNFLEAGEPVKNKDGIPEFAFIAMAKLHGQNQASPIALRITDSQVQIQLLVPQNVEAKKLPYPPTVGLAYGLKVPGQGQEELAYFLNENGFL